MQAFETSLKINPEFGPSLMMLGALAMMEGDLIKAANYYKKTIKANRKYLDAYVQLAGIYTETNVTLARKILKDCLNVNSRYIPAIKALADTYRTSSPEVAKKYDQLINSLNNN